MAAHIRLLSGECYFSDFKFVVLLLRVNLPALLVVDDLCLLDLVLIHAIIVFLATEEYLSGQQVSLKLLVLIRRCCLLKYLFHLGAAPFECLPPLFVILGKSLLQSFALLFVCFLRAPQQ